MRRSLSRFSRLSMIARWRDDPVPLLPDDANQRIAVGSPEVDTRFHSRYVT